MQNYYQQNVFDDQTLDVTLQLSLVGTLCGLLSNSMSLPAQILRSIYGTKFVLNIGSTLMVIGLVAAGFTTEIWHLYLTQAVCFGAGVGFVYSTSLAIAPQYFYRKRGVALGCLSSGASIGGLVIPFMMTPINNSLGGAWTYRILGIICFVFTFLGCYLTKDRVPLPRSRKSVNVICSLDIFRNKNYLLWCLAATFQMAGYYIPSFYIPSYATYLGLSTAQGSALISINFASNFFGRFFSGALGDRLGPINSNFLFVTITGLSSMLLWKFAYSYGMLIAFMIVFGFACGSYFSLVSPIVAFLLSTENFSIGLAINIFIAAFGILGATLASAIESHVTPEPFLTFKMFTGVAYILASFTLLCLKLNVNRTLLAKV
ncbi:major facilitator superfamily domain-containing protein [Zychaea mexicana]|uniref:major facilitator superfamily domain-containing protein n=1 Tax=Zychaea mexicana TaxID=64656 RepID=UPI0022FE6654|nr:major facilitator superfamily domain-containing protein [Zychaea mexicana]KAI9488035.1 major facilitator superfamily domain-containing protein [Zychaea mexicana]